MGSKSAVVVVRNNTAYPQTLKKRTPVARAVVATAIPELPVELGLPDGVDETQDPHIPKLTVRQRQGKLFKELDLSGLQSWPPAVADSAQMLLAEYHDVFSLEPGELGCIHSTEHVIKVTYDIPFKEQFRWIPPPLVEEVHNHLRQMLESGTIWPSQSVWCNMVMLVRKKDRGLHFCIDFCHLNAHMKDSYPLPRIQKALESLVGAGHFYCLDLKSGFWQIKMDEALKQYTTFIVGNLGFFECDHMPFRLCNVLATFQWLMQKCLSKLNLIYCLVYLDDIIIFLQMAEEHLHWLHVVFDWFREYNLKLKPSKCNFLRRRSTTWHIESPKVECALNLKAITECVLPQTYMEMHAFLSLVGRYQQSIKGFTHIAQPLNKHLTGQGASRKSEQVLLLDSGRALKAFNTLKQACMTAPVLAFADYTKEFLLETDASKDGLEAVLSQKQMDGQYHPVANGSRALTPPEKNYHSTKLKFLALKWAVTEHFKEYLPYQPFLVKTDNNPLTYIMMTPNFDATGHCWVRALARFNFQLEYQKECDNTIADVLSQITTHLDPDMVRSVLDGIILGAAHRVESHDPTVVEGDHGMEKEVCVTTGWVLVQMHMTDWAEAQREDPLPSAGLNCLEAHKKADLKHFWPNMPPVRRADWSGKFDKTSQLIKRPYTCALCPRVRMKIFCSL